ncbi:MAG: four helix bundle protein [candidate division KSB1 bacterium]|nr:four helix bundle protein [candidate division KSB1 bacterium]MDZ7342685.1 four helix bundle protein [candidate division KSB1 bacterium]
MNKDDLKDRFKQFALRIIRLCQSLPNDKVSSVISGQLLRAGTSSAANYRAACRAKSTADFVYKLQIVEEELDESLYWMELLIEAKLMAEHLLKELMTEGNELLSITISSIRTTKSRTK